MASSISVKLLLQFLLKERASYIYFEEGCFFSREWGVISYAGDHVFSFSSHSIVLPVGGIFARFAGLPTMRLNIDDPVYLILSGLFSLVRKFGRVIIGSVLSFSFRVSKLKKWYEYYTKNQKILNLTLFYQILIPNCFSIVCLMQAGIFTSLYV